jgi:hypothetical protein
MESEKFCLRWNDFQTNISEAFRELREEKEFFDVNLACGDNQIQAHKVILSACSPFFRNVLRRNPHQHPLIYLKGVKHKELLSVLNFMYVGEVNIGQDELNSFLTVAEDLKVKGLTQGNAGDHEKPKSKREANSGSISQPSKSHIATTLLQAQQQVANHPHPALSQAQVTNISKYHQQVEEEEIQEIIPVKSEPHEASQQSSNVDQQGAVALEESYSELESYDYQFEETGYEDGASNMQYVGDDTGKGENNSNTLLCKRNWESGEGPAHLVPTSLLSQIIDS